MKKLLAVLAISALAMTGCSLPWDKKDEKPTEKVEQFPGYTQTQLADRIWEVRFTDTEGKKMKCFVYSSYNQGGLDGCKEVG